MSYVEGLVRQDASLKFAFLASRIRVEDLALRIAEQIAPNQNPYNREEDCPPAFIEGGVLGLRSLYEVSSRRPDTRSVFVIARTDQGEATLLSEAQILATDEHKPHTPLSVKGYREPSYDYPLPRYSIRSLVGLYDDIDTLEIQARGDDVEPASGDHGAYTTRAGIRIPSLDTESRRIFDEVVNGINARVEVGIQILGGEDPAPLLATVVHNPTA